MSRPPFEAREDDDVRVDLVLFALQPGIDSAIVSHGYIVAAAPYVRAHHSSDGAGFIYGTEVFRRVQTLVETGHTVTVRQHRMKVNPFFATGGTPAVDEVEEMFGFDRPGEQMMEPFCACGRVVSRCDGSRRACGAR